MLPYQIHEPTLPSVIHHQQNNSIGESTAHSSLEGEHPQGKAIYGYVPVRANQVKK